MKAILEASIKHMNLRQVSGEVEVSCSACHQVMDLVSDEHSALRRAGSYIDHDCATVNPRA